MRRTNAPVQKLSVEDALIDLEIAGLPPRALAVLAELCERIRAIEEAAGLYEEQPQASEPDPLEANHQAFLGRIREQEARGSE